MRSMNKVMLIGHLASDPEARQTKTGKTVVNFPLATNRDWYTTEGEKRQEADFHRIIAWQKLGEICCKYIRKGSGVLVEGRISNRSYEDKTGNRKYITEIIADGINILTWTKTEEGANEVNLSKPGQE